MYTLSYPTQSIMEKWLGCGSLQPLCGSLHPSLGNFSWLNNEGKGTFPQPNPGIISELIRVANCKGPASNHLTNKSIIGLDMPVLVTDPKRKEESKGTVVILAQDPLRGSSKSTVQTAKDIVLGLPFALQDGNAKGCTSVIRGSNNSIVEHLISKGYDVYLTDIFKLYMRELQNNKVYPDENLYNEYLDLLRQELKQVGPAFVLTIGKEASRVMGMFCPFVHNLVHPSNNNNGQWQKLQTANPQILKTLDLADKMKYLTQDIDTYIQLLSSRTSGKCSCPCKLPCL